MAIFDQVVEQAAGWAELQQPRLMSLKTIEIRLQVSLSGSFCTGRWLTNDPRMSSGVGTGWGSLTSVGCDCWGVIRLVMQRNLPRSVSCTDFSTVLMLASLTFGQIVENASL